MNDFLTIAKLDIMSEILKTMSEKIQDLEYRLSLLECEDELTKTMLAVNIETTKEN